MLPSFSGPIRSGDLIRLALRRGDGRSVMKKNHWPIVALLAAAGVPVMGTALQAADPAPCPAQCATGKVPLGVAVPLTGSVSAFGKPAARAVDLAVADINAAGGLLG